MHFKDRHEAGLMLAKALSKYANKKDVIVLAIPRGGVEVGCEVAKKLKAKLDIIITKKIGMPGDEEFAIGSVAPDKSYIANRNIADVYNIPEERIREMAGEIGAEIERRYKEYKGRYSLESLKGKTVILVDDGIATGFTTQAAIGFARKKGAKKVVLAVPVAPGSTIAEMKEDADEIVCLQKAEKFFAISQFYERFPQLSDGEVRKFLRIERKD
ncbi:phosphoribosyltransferase [Candidatus Woesearchaeota archaeon]|nr:phosphoribosyltransferase [Candidatus Woesearchaeota archaeon]